MVASGTPRLPIRAILDANPAWMRGSDEDLGDLYDLKRSIQINGVLVPLLVEPDNRVLDGARRLLAANDLGYDVVPVSIINNWEQAYKEFVAVRQAENSGLPHLPMDMFAVESLIAALKVIYEPTMRAASAVAAKESRRTGVKTRREGGQRVSMFDQQLTEMLGMGATPLKALRSTMASLRDCYDISVELGQEAERHVRDYLKNGGKTWTLRALLNDLKNGTQSTLNPRRLRPDGELINTRRIPVEPDAKKGKEQVDAVSEMLRVLEDLGRIVTQMDNFNPAVDVDTLVALQQRRKAAVGGINRLRPLLETAIKAKESETTS